MGGPGAMVLLSIVSGSLMPSVFLFATLDTKGREADFVRALLTSWGVAVTLVDVGALGTPAVTADVSRERIFELAETTIEAVRQRADRGEAVTKAAAGAARLAREAYARGEVSGILGLGGFGGNDHRDGGDAGAAARRTESDGQHARVRAWCGSSSATKTSSCSTRWWTSSASTA